MDRQLITGERGCRFFDNGVKCTKYKDLHSPFFCPNHKNHFAQLDNQQLLEVAARRVREMMYVAENKRVKWKDDAAIRGDIDNYFNELDLRGYSPREMVEAIMMVQDHLKLNDDLDKAVGIDPKWRKFEKVVAGIHKLKDAGAKVIFNDKIKGKSTGRNKQIDVSVRFQQGYYEYLIIIECKDYKRKVSVEKVEALNTKMQEVGASLAVMVSAEGFQAGAIEAAKAYNIELRTLSEEMRDWTKVVKEQVVKVPYPTWIEFDHDPLSETIESNPVSWDEILFYRVDRRDPLTLTQVVRNIMEQVQAGNERLPAEATVPFEPAWFAQFPQQKSPFLVRGIKIRFEPYEWRSAREIDVPPMLAKYIYADVEGKQKEEIPISAVPIGLDTVLEPGKYYEDRAGRFFRCLAIEGDTALWLAMNIKRDEEGRAYHQEFEQEAKHAHYYVPVTASSVIEQLERVYQTLVEKERRESEH